MSDQPKQLPSLRKLLESVGLGAGGRRHENVKRVSRELACQMFAAAYLQTYSVELAYRAIRAKSAKPGTGPRRSRHQVIDTGRRWLASKRVSEIVRTEIQKALSKSHLDLRLLCERLQEQMDSNLFDYMEFDQEGVFKRFKFDVGGLDPNRPPLTRAQMRAVRSVSFDSKTGTKVTKITLVDPQRAQEQWLALVALTRKLGEQNEEGTLPAELIRHIEASQLKRSDLLERLPPSRIRHIIEGESKPV